MTKRRLFGIATLVVLVLVAAAVAYASAAHQYQFTGTVTAIDGTNLTVQKSAKETWIFSTEGMTVTAKKGDKVTVYYHMVAEKIDVKPAPAPKAKK